MHRFTLGVEEEFQIVDPETWEPCGALLERMDVDAIRSEGYSYFVECIYQVKRLTDHGGGTLVRMTEFPIRFADRRAGSSKISKKEIWKGFSTLFRLGVQRALPFTGQSSGQSFGTGARRDASAELHVPE